MARKPAKKPAMKPARKAAPKPTRKPKRKTGRNQLKVQQDILRMNAIAKKFGIKEIDLKTVRSKVRKLEKLATEIDAEELKSAELIADALQPLIAKKLYIPSQGYLVTRGQGRVIVTPAEGKA